MLLSGLNSITVLKPTSATQMQAMRRAMLEVKVGYHRHNFLVPVPRFDNLQEFNRELLTKRAIWTCSVNITVMTQPSPNCSKKTKMPCYHCRQCLMMSVDTSPCALMPMPNSALITVPIHTLQLPGMLPAQCW